MKTVIARYTDSTAVVAPGPAAGARGGLRAQLPPGRRDLQERRSVEHRAGQDAEGVVQGLHLLGPRLLPLLEVAEQEVARGVERRELRHHRRVLGVRLVVLPFDCHQLLLQLCDRLLLRDDVLLLRLPRLLRPHGDLIIILLRLALRHLLLLLKMQQQEEEMTESQSQKDYDEVAMRTKESREAKEKDVVAKQETVAKLEEELMTIKRENDETNSEHASVMSKLAALHASCDFLLGNFEERKKARAEEVESLNNALGILSGAVLDGPSFLQVSASQKRLRA